MKIGLVGCGTIGTLLAQMIVERLANRAQLVALHDLDPTKSQALNLCLNQHIPCLALRPLVQRSQLVIEAASAAVAAQVVEEALGAKRDCLVMSTGGLLNRPDLFKRAREMGCRIYLPAGALAGVDALHAARQDEIHQITLTTKKPPEALKGSPYVVQHHINLDTLTQETTIFEGGVEEAIVGFPQNINVAATIALASGRPDLIQVKIVATPGEHRNIHEIEVVGLLGRILARTENVPAETNPRTSQLAVLSAMATLESIVMGT